MQAARCAAQVEHARVVAQHSWSRPHHLLMMTLSDGTNKQLFPLSGGLGALPPQRTRRVCRLHADGVAIANIIVLCLARLGAHLPRGTMFRLAAVAVAVAAELHPAFVIIVSTTNAEQERQGLEQHKYYCLVCPQQ